MFLKPQSNLQTKHTHYSKTLGDLNTKPQVKYNKVLASGMNTGGATVAT